MTRAGHALEVAIACSQPKEMHTNPTRVMRERGIDLSGSLSNDLNRFARRRFDYVIHPVRPGAEICPSFLTAGTHLLESPTALEGDADAESCPTVQRTAAQWRPVCGSCSKSSHKTPQEVSYMSEDTVNVRYMVDDVAEAIRFYTDHLGFVGLLSRWWPSERQPASAQGG